MAIWNWTDYCELDWNVGILRESGEGDGWMWIVVLLLLLTTVCYGDIDVQYSATERRILDDASDSSFIVEHSKFVKVRGHRIRVVWNGAQMNKSPMYVFVHGLGGQAVQFEDILQGLESLPFIAIDLPGCGQSEYRARVDYGTEVMAEMIEAVIEQVVGSESRIVLVGHSMGCVLAARVAMSRKNVQNVVLICPKAALTIGEERMLRVLAQVPLSLFDVLRRLDRGRLGAESHSVTRLLGSDPSDMVKQRQMLWNLQSESRTFQNYVRGMRLLRAEEWAMVRQPLTLIAAECVRSKGNWQNLKKYSRIQLQSQKKHKRSPAGYHPGSRSLSCLKPDTACSLKTLKRYSLS